MITNVGKYFIRELIQGKTHWSLLNGGSNKHLYMGIGTSTDTNAGVTGPTTSTPIAVDNGIWTGPSPNDWKLSNEYNLDGQDRPQAHLTVQSNGVIYVQALFPSSCFPSGQEIVEYGLFCQKEIEEGASPLDVNSDANKKKAMIARIVDFNVEAEQFTPNITNVNSSSDFIVNLHITDFARS
jgi:hypothetical protein